MILNPLPVSTCSTQYSRTIQIVQPCFANCVAMPVIWCWMWSYLNMVNVCFGFVVNLAYCFNYTLLRNAVWGTDWKVYLKRLCQTQCQLCILFYFFKYFFCFSMASDLKKNSINKPTCMCAIFCSNIYCCTFCICSFVIFSRIIALS